MALPINDNDEAVANWQMIPDTEGRMHMEDINSYHEEIEESFNAANDVRFLLFTRSNPTNGIAIQFNNNAQLANSPFNPTHQTR